MDEESSLGLYIGRAGAAILGLVGGFFAVYLLVAVSAGGRRGEALVVDEKAIAARAEEAPLLAAAVPVATSGEAIFYQRCAACHGTDASGKGMLAPLLTSAPRDLNRGPYWLRSTPFKTAPVRDDIKKVVERGISGTNMPGFDYALAPSNPGADDGVDLVVDLLIKNSAYLAKPGKPVELKEQAEGVDWELEAGKTVYDALKCAECHGSEGFGDGPKLGELKDSRGQSVHVPDLSAPWDFRRGAETHQIWLAFEIGIDETYMPALTSKSTLGDRLALAAYVRSLARKLLDTEDMKKARERRGIVEHGRNMVQLMACAHCHSMRDTSGLTQLDHAYAGGVEFTSPDGTFYSANLTSDEATGIGKVSDDELTAALLKGQTRRGDRISPLVMPWTWYSKLTTSDTQAIIAFLRTVPAVANKVAESVQQNVGISSRLGTMFGSHPSWVQAKAQSVASATATPEVTAPTQVSVDKSPADVEHTAKVPASDPDPKTEVGAVADDENEVEDAVELSPDAQLAAAKARYDEAKQRLNDAAAAFARAEADYQKAQSASGNKDKKKSKKSKKKKKRSRRER